MKDDKIPRVDFTQEEYTIGSHFLCPLFNGDYSGLEDEDIAALDAFLEALPDGSGHWAGGDEEDHEEFAECEVTGLMSDCHRVVWMREVKP